MATDYCMSQSEVQLVVRVTRRCQASARIETIEAQEEAELIVADLVHCPCRERFPVPVQMREGGRKENEAPVTTRAVTT